MIFTEPQIFFFLSTIVLIFSLTALLISLLTWKKINKISGQNINSIFSEIKKNKSEIKDLRRFEIETLKNFQSAFGRIAKCVKTPSLVRFTPYKGIGSKGGQSFSSAFLNEEGDGIVMSGLYYSQDRISIYTKPIKSHKSEIDLTPEEKEVINSSKTQKN